LNYLVSQAVISSELVNIYFNSLGLAIRMYAQRPKANAPCIIDTSLFLISSALALLIRLRRTV